MTPEQFKERLLTDPFDNSWDILEAIKADPALRNIRDELIKFEFELTSALNDVQIPEYSVLMAAAHLPGYSSREGMFNWLRSYSFPIQNLAVSVIFLLSISALGLLMVGNLRLRHLESLYIESLVQHIYDDTASLQPVTLETFSGVAQAFAQAGGRWLPSDTASLLKIGYAVPCEIFQNIDSVHLLVKDDRGYVNAVFVRNSPVPGEIEVGDARFSGISFSTGSDAIVIIGERDAMRSMEQLKSLKDRLAVSMEWDNQLASGGPI